MWELAWHASFLASLFIFVSPFLVLIYLFQWALESARQRGIRVMACWRSGLA